MNIKHKYRVFVRNTYDAAYRYLGDTIAASDKQAINNVKYKNNQFRWNDNYGKEYKAEMLCW